LSPILGIIASQNYPRITNSYESIATISPGGTASATFSSIPSTYKHLQIRAFVRGGGSTSSVDAVLMRFNGDSSSSNYVTLHQLYGSGASAGAQASTGNGWIYQSYIPGAAALASVFGPYVTDILDYTSTNKNKTTRTLAGVDQNGSGYITFSSGLWMNSSTAISSINMVLDGSNNFANGTHFALYGIKG
jgi:hypothetical protein